MTASTSMALSEGAPLHLTEDDPRDAVAAMHRAATRFADHGVRTVSGGGDYLHQTYPDLLARARVLLGGLRAHGLGAGDAVVLHGLPLADFFPAFWACLLGGLLPVPIAEPWSPAAADPRAERLRHVCRLLGRPLVLTGDAAGLREVTDGFGTDRPAAVTGLDACERAEPATDLHTPGADDVALLILSSGSTGMSKAVRLTHRALADGAASFDRAMGIGSGHVTLNWLPVDHSGALLLYHVNAVFAGATNVHVPTESVLADPLVWLDLMAEHTVNHSWAPMFGYQLVLDALAGRAGRGWDLSAVRTLLCGGEQVLAQATSRFLAAVKGFGVDASSLVPAWGMAETTSAVTCGRFAGPDGVRHVTRSSLGGDLVPADADTDESDRITFVAAGAPVPGVGVRVVDRDGVLLPENRIGRLQVRAARLMAGYLDDPGADAAVFPGGDRTWLDSGDLAFLSRGTVVITGRAKDVIILNGHNHSCHEIEEVVRAAGVGTAGVAACGVPDPVTGTERLALFAVAGDADRAAAERTVREALFARLRLSDCRVVLLAEQDFPRTPSGKTRRAELRERLLAGRYDEPVPALAMDVREVIGSVLGSVLGREVGADTPFYELGMTSVTLMRARVRLGAELGRPVAPTALFRYPTITSLADHLTSHSTKASTVDEPAPAPAPTPVPDDRVAIIGMAVRFPGARTVEEFWTNLRGGVDSVRTFPPDGPVPPDRRLVGGVLDDVDAFDAGFFGVSPREAELTEPAHRLFLETCHHALEHSGYAGDEHGHRVGVFAGSGMHLYGHQDGPPDTPPDAPDAAAAMMSTIGSEPDFLASRVAYRLGLTGPAIGVQTACSTSLVAVHLAARAVQSGDADIAVAGAAAVRVPQEAGYRYEPGSILSPTGACRAFDADADGTVGGNGVAAVVLKPLRAALADGDPVHAVILGSAVNNDGRGKVGFTAPGAAGQEAVIRQALARANVPPSTVSYVEAHGTGTELGDPVEFDALRSAYRAERTGFCTLGSVKPNVGHLDSCAGMAGLVKTVLMLQHRELVPTVNLKTPNPALELAGSPFVLATEGREWTVTGSPRRAGVSAFGVGGTNAHLILEEAPPVDPPPGDGRAVLVPVSAADPDALAELAGTLREHLLANPSVRAADVARTLATGRAHLPLRVTAVGRDAAELAAAFATAPPAAPELPAGPLVFAFSGQGRVRAGLAAGLYAEFPVVRRVLDECSAELRAALLAGPPEPLPAGLAQPALFALQAALVELWRSAGIEPDCVLGHSLGEYAALYAAGAMSFADGLRLTAARGAAMAATEPGGMLAVNADLGVVRRIAADTGLELAAVNGSTAHTLSGPAAAVERAATRAGAAGRRLEVAHAFHSVLVEPALPALRDAAAGVRWRPLRVPLVAGLDGRLRPAGTLPAADLLCRGAREPVRFDAMLATVDGAGYRDVVELGPGAMLTAFGRRGSASRWLPTMDGADPAAAFLTAAGALYRRGARIDWAALTPEAGRRIPLPGYPFRKHRFAVRATTTPQRTDDVTEPVDEVRLLTARLLGMPVEAVDPDRSFVNLGADSLSLMTMVRDLDEDFGVSVPVRQLFGETDTPRKLAALLGVREAPTVTPAPATEPALPVASEAPARPNSPVSANSASPGDLRSIVDRQLALAERMVDQVTSLMAGQLALLGGTAQVETPAPPATEPARTRPPETVPLPTDPPRTVPLPTDPPRTDPLPTDSLPTDSLPADPPRTDLLPDDLPRTDLARTAPVPDDAAACAFSLYFFGDYPDQDADDKYHLITAAARFADRHGFHSLWLPERHFHSFGALFPNPSVLAAALAAQTERIRLNAGSVVLPLHNPIRVAEEWSVVDNLSHGRVGLCVASGWHATDFVLAPQNFGKHRELMYTQLDTVRRLWAGEAVSAVSGSGEEVDVRLHPRPVQARPPMFVAVVGNPDSYRMAARNDLGVVTNLMAQDVDQLAENIALYRRTRAEHGLDPAAGRIVVLVHTYLGEDAEEVRREAFRPFCDYLRSSLSLFDQVTNSLGVDIDLDAMTPDDVDFLLGRAYERYCESRALIGTAETGAPVADRLVAAGVDEIACFVDFGVAPDRVLSGLSTLDKFRARYAGPPARPLTAAQRRIWFLDRLYPDQPIYHEPKAIRLTGPLDPAALRAAIHRVVARQPALRTVFREQDDEPRQVVLPHVELDCPLVDVTGVPEDEVLRDALRTTAGEVFDLATGPLLSARLFRLSGEHHLLFLSAHHIVFDSASTAVFLRDLAACYRAFPAEPDLPRLAPAPAEAPASAEDVERWRAHFAGAPALQLPTDRPRPARRTGAGAALRHDLDRELTERLARLSQGQGVTMFMTLLGAVAAVLGRFAAQDDVVLGTAVANRPRGTEDAVGLFLDTVALRIDLAGDPAFTELADRVRDTMTDALSQVPFDELVRALNPDRDPGANPLFRVMVEYENETTVEFAPPDLQAANLDLPADRAPFDLSLYLTRHAAGVRIGVEYDTDLFTEQTVLRLLRLLEVTLRRVVGDPSARLAELTAPTDADLADLAVWQGIPATGGACLHELVEARVDRDPGATALVDGDAELTYRTLDERANAVANRLLAGGIGRGDLVGVCLPRGSDLVVALLGVLKSGAAYLPLDPGVPAARIDQLVADSGARLVLREVEPGGDPARPAIRVDQVDPAYCVYTSGSTGRPKGVLVPHRGPANVVRWQAAQHGPLRTLQWTSPSFDVSVQEIFSTLAAGAALVLVDDRLRYDPAGLAEAIRAHRVERLFMPYTPLKYLMETKPDLPSVRTIVSAGESLLLTPALRGFLAEHADCVLYNQYGPTEGSIIVTSHRVDPAGESAPPIGTPIDGVTVQVLDGRRRQVPAGAVGEIHIGGIAVADGYLGRPEETAESFVGAGDARLYRTGDLGRWRADGTLEFLGRRDDQVKIRGHRVEPGEAERAVAELDGVLDAAVVARRDPAGEPELRVYVVLAEGTDLAALRARLGAVLPSWLVPGQWVPVDKLAFNANGKLDIAALPEPPREAGAGAEPVTVAEQAVHDLWCAELGHTSVPVDASFFALGGHSLSAVRLLNRAADRLGVGCSMSAFFADPTIRGLAGLLDTGEVVDTAPLTAQQRRLWRLHHEVGDPAVYNVTHRVDVSGPLDAAALERAVEALVHRHAALRMRVGADGRQQEILAPFPVALPVEDLTAFDDAALDGWCRAAAAGRFALDQAPLFRVLLGRRGPDRWVVVVVLNHMVCDGWSLGILWEELSALYAGGALEPAPRHSDYARWERDHVAGERRAELARFWRAELAGAELTLPLPADRPRPARLSGRGAVHESALPPGLVTGLRSAAAGFGATPYAVLAAAFARWAARLTGRPEVVLPTSTANRVRAEHERVVGMVGDAALVRLRPAGADTGELVSRVSAALYAALDHQELRLADVVELCGGGYPNLLFTVVTGPAPALVLGEAAVAVHELGVPGVARNELYVRIVLGAEQDEATVSWEYSTDLFDASTVAGWAEGLVAAIAEVIAGE